MRLRVLAAVVLVLGCSVAAHAQEAPRVGGCHLMARYYP
jgi:hypothetical protein